MSPSMGGTTRRRPGAQRRLPLAVTLLVIARLACAELSVRIQEYQFTLGDNVTIEWEGGTEPVTLQLFFQDEDSGGAFKLKEEIASNQKGEGTLEWQTRKELEPGMYNIGAFDEKDPEPNYDYPFTVDENDDTVEVADAIGVPNDNANPAEATPTQTSTPAPTEKPPTESEDPEPAGGSGGLNTGAKAGIGVGAGASGLVMLLLVTVLLRRRHRARHPTDPEENGYAYPRAPSAAADRFSDGRRTPLTPRRFTPTPVSPRAPTPSKSPSSSGILSHFPRSFTPKLAKAFSWSTLRTASPAKSPTPTHEKGKKVHVVGPLTELPAGDVDYEVPNRHELPTPANTPELPGSSHGDRSPRWE